MLTFHTFNCVILQKIRDHDRNEIDLDLQKHLLLELFAYKIYTFLLLAWHISYLTCICIFGALKFKPIIKSSYH